MFNRRVQINEIDMMSYNNDRRLPMYNDCHHRSTGTLPFLTMIYSKLNQLITPLLITIVICSLIVVTIDKSQCNAVALPQIYELHAADSDTADKSSQHQYNSIQHNTAQSTSATLNVLPFADTPGDSTAIKITVDPPAYQNSRLGYPLCHFTNVCVTDDSVLFRVQNYNAWQYYNSVFSRCFDSSISQHDTPYEICQCFHLFYKPVLLPYEYDTQVYKDKYKYNDIPIIDHTIDYNKMKRVITNPLTTIDNSHYWSIHKWVSHAHIAHWTQKLMYWQSIYQHRSVLPFSTIDKLLFHDTTLPVPEHFVHILNMTLQSALDDKHALYRKYFYDNDPTVITDSQSLMSITHKSDNQYLCMSELSMTPTYGMLSDTSFDTEQFRKSAYKHYDLYPAGINKCPPRRAVLLYRENRGILNWQQIELHLLDTYNIVLERETISERNTSIEQAALFASTGLLISSHSSQLINVIFSHPSQVIIEMTANFYNSDFAQYAHAMGVKFEYALGGSILNGIHHDINQQCVDTLNNICGTDGQCVQNNSWRCRGINEDNKYFDYDVDMNVAKLAIRNAINHLQWTCNGRWLK